MLYLIILILVVIILFLIWKGFIGERPSAKEPALDIVKRQAKEKEENLAKVREFFKQNEQAANDDIQKLLGVSDASATRYMDELEKDGFIRQAGVTGSGVRYKRVK